MDTKTRQTRIGLTLLAGLFAIAAACAGSASIRDWGAVSNVTPVDPNAPARAAAYDPPARAATPGAADDGAPGIVLPAERAARRSINCAGCGVVESVRRIDRQEITPSSHRIVIRFRDGSRQVFDEATARTMQPGERVQVIAGLDLPSR